MRTVLIEPTDVLFFRDAVPMAAGAGQGRGARLPFPSTLHEAFRASLLLARGERAEHKHLPGRPRDAIRKGNWHENGRQTDVFVASKSFRSLSIVGPLPFDEKDGPLFPVPFDAMRDFQGRLEPLRLLVRSEVNMAASDTFQEFPPRFTSHCCAASVTPPDKRGVLSGWWTLDQLGRYLEGQSGNDFEPRPTQSLWESEYRIGLEIAPDTGSARERQLFAGSYLRLRKNVRLIAGLRLADPRDSEESELSALDWLLLGGERRLARLESPPGDPWSRIPPVPTTKEVGPCLLKWVLVTPAIFAHGSIPGWCMDSRRDAFERHRPPGRVCFPSVEELGRAQLVAHISGRPVTVSGWDVVEQRAKSTQLAVAAGAVYYFLCENGDAANELARALHWRPRSDHYGEKGCGYGVCSFAVNLHRTSADIRALANRVFSS